MYDGGWRSCMRVNIYTQLWMIFLRGLRRLCSGNFHSICSCISNFRLLANFNLVCEDNSQKQQKMLTLWNKSWVPFLKSSSFPCWITFNFALLSWTIVTVELTFSQETFFIKTNRMHWGFLYNIIDWESWISSHDALRQ